VSLTQPATLTRGQVGAGDQREPYARIVRKGRAPSTIYPARWQVHRARDSALQKLCASDRTTTWSRLWNRQGRAPAEPFISIPAYITRSWQGALGSLASVGDTN